MAKWARIQNGAIAEIVTSDPATLFTPVVAAMFVPVHDDAIYRATWNDQTQSWDAPPEPDPVPDPLPIPVEQIKTQRLAELNTRFRSARDAGVYVNGVLLETTPQVQSELTSLVARLTRVGGTQGIATRSGFVGDVDLATATALYRGVEDYISLVWQNDADITAAIKDAETTEDVLAIDIDTGWPSRNEPE